MEYGLFYSGFNFLGSPLKTVRGRGMFLSTSKYLAIDGEARRTKRPLLEAKHRHHEFSSLPRGALGKGYERINAKATIVF